MPVASMPMYDMPEAQAALDSLWAGMVRHLRREGLGEVPDRNVVVAEDYEANDVLEMFGAVCVVNGFELHSGSNALKALVAPRNQDGRFFSEIKAPMSPAWR